DIADMADDCIRQVGEGLRIVGYLAGVFALETFGRELDRRQGVLDLVRDAARDVGPRCLALGRYQLGDVVEGDDVAVDLAFETLGGDTHEQGLRAVLPRQFDLRLRETFGAALRLVEQYRHLGRDRSQF